MKVQDYLVVEGRLNEELKNLDVVLAHLEKLGLYPKVQTDCVGSFPVTDENAARVIGSYLQDFYNCFENMARVIARWIDGTAVPQGPDWHAELLRQMSASVRGVRPSLISEKTYKMMDEYRRFRHVFRNIYGFVLDPSRTMELLEQLPEAVASLKKDLTMFLDKMSKALGIA